MSSWPGSRQQGQMMIHTAPCLLAISHLDAGLAWLSQHHTRLRSWRRPRPLWRSLAAVLARRHGAPDLGLLAAGRRGGGAAAKPTKKRTSDVRITTTHSGRGCAREAINSRSRECEPTY